MAQVRGCNFPDRLLYDVPSHTWYAPEADGIVRAGMTPVAVALAREVLVFTPRRVGSSFERGRSFATIESAKWVGAVRAAFDGSIVAVNETLIARPTIANEDCYEAGWLLRVRPADAGWRAALTTGQAAADAYEAWMEQEAFAGCGKQ
ncbi:glycine cleavage system protein H [Pseudorhodoplanes sp.]|uniref:glycine cleavage system protein H n=1 Tax=Pseudorhodoplanes sp. TaxID=1934341 RepID=UPI003D09FDEA